MPTYRAPVNDWLFLLHDVLRVDQHGDLPGFADLTMDFTGPVLDAAARFHAEVLHPMNQAADQEGARIADGEVTTPKGYRAAWDAYRAAGWHRLSLAAELGGAGLPPVMSVPVTELRAATGHSFSMYNSFCAPTAAMLSVMGPAWMRQHVVPRLSDGDWTATMCMTEPQAGTDLRQLNTRAVQQADGSWRITGRKIFISGGEHDLTDNIVHVVLAKVPGDDGRLQPGLGSVAVFLVSKYLIDPATGALGGRNAVRAASIEHKMGIEGSATCAMEFDGALGWRLGEARGSGSAASMAPMFHLMNYARVGTAMSGVAYAEIATQNAAAYARERRSGRAVPAPREPQAAADAIIVHADVRRLLLEARAFTEGARAGAMRAALWQSVAAHAADPAERERAADLLDLLTPVMKAFFTDRGFDATVACQQVLGGHGYVKDYGIEQFVRNARIGQLYEGANGIQATDLVHRKLLGRGGRARGHFTDAMRRFVDAHEGDAALAPFVMPLRRGLQRVDQTLAWMAERSTSAPAQVDAGAYDLLTALGVLYVGWNWAEIAAVALRPASWQVLDAATAEVKLTLARVWMQRQMPLLDALCARVECGNECLLALADELV